MRAHILLILASLLFFGCQTNQQTDQSETNSTQLSQADSSPRTFKTINLDGDFTDWEDVSPSNLGSDAFTISTTQDDDNLYLLISSETEFDPENLQIMLDVDDNPATGWSVDGWDECANICVGSEMYIGDRSRIDTVGKRLSRQDDQDFTIYPDLGVVQVQPMTSTTQAEFSLPISAIQDLNPKANRLRLTVINSVNSLQAPALGYITHRLDDNATTHVIIDQNFDDWSTIDVALEDGFDASAPNAGPDWGTIRMTDSADYLFIHFDSDSAFNFDGSPDYSFSRLLILIDADNNTATGFPINDIGAELVVNGQYLFTLGDGDDAFTREGLLSGVDLAQVVSVTQSELAIPLNQIRALNSNLSEIKMVLVNDDGLNSGDVNGEEAQDFAPSDGHVSYSLRYPVAMANENTTLVLGEAVTLDASSSTSPDGGELTYAWEIVTAPEGNTASIVDTSAANTSFTPDALGVYRIRATVTTVGETSFSDTSTFNLTVVSDANLLVHYPFDQDREKTQNFATFAQDISGRENHAAVYGPSLTADRDELTEQAYHFSDHWNTIQLPDRMLNGLNEVTVSLWMRSDQTDWLDQSTNGVGLLSGTASSSFNNEFLLFLRKDGKISPYIKNNNQNASTDVADNQWHHVVLTRELAGLVRIYVDGVLDMEKQMPAGPLDLPADSVFVGHEQDSVGDDFERKQQYIGDLDELRIYDRALSSDEVITLYETDQPRKLVDAGEDVAANEGDAVTLQGSSDFTAPVFAWALLEKPADSAVELTDTTSANLSFVPDATGNYVFQLTVTEGEYTLKDNVVVNVGGLMASYPADTVELTDASLTEDRFGTPENAYRCGDTYPSLVQLLDDQVLNVESGVSFAAWVRTDKQDWLEASTNGVGVLSGASSNFHNEFLMFINNNGTVSPYIKNKNFAGDQQVADGQWHHIVVTRELTGMVKIYVDGQFDKEKKLTEGRLNIGSGGLWLCNDQTSIGDGWDRGQQFVGDLGDVRLYNRVLSAEAVTALYQDSQDLVAYLTFSGDANDVSGNENHGTVNGASLTNDRHGISDSAYQFDGIDTRVSGIWNQPFSNEVTLAAWFKSPGGGKGSPRLVEFSDATGDFNLSTAIAYGTDGSLRAWSNCQTTGTRMGEIDLSEPLYNDDQWHHAVLVVDGTDTRLYMDGELMQTANDDMCADITDAETWIVGAYYPNDEHAYLGDIDDVRIYKKALSAGEVQSLFASESPLLIANAGEDQSTEVDQGVTLSGSSEWSEDPNVSYAWTVDASVPVENYTLTDADTLAPTFTPLASGRFTLTLTVSNGVGNATDTVQVHTTGLVLQLPFNGDANDTSGLNNHASQTNATLSQDRHGQIDSAFQFDGALGRISGQWDQPFEAEATLIAWFKSAGGGEGSPRLVEFSDAEGNFNFSTAIAYDTDGSLRAWSTCATTSTRMAEVDYSDTVYKDDEWHQAVYVVNGTDGRLYVDGELKQTASDDVCADVVDAKTWVVGAYYPDDNHTFNGSVDEVRVYNKALTEAEVLNLYEAEKAEQIITTQSAVSLDIATPTQLSATSTWDADSSYTWSVLTTSPENAVTLENANTATPDVTANLPGTWELGLTVENTLTLAQAQTTVQVTAQGVVALYELDGDATDSSGLGNDATVSGAVATTDRLSAENAAMSFDGVDDAIRGQWNQAFDAEVTLLAWFKSAGGGGNWPRLVEFSNQGGVYNYSTALAYNPDGALRAWSTCASNNKRMAEIEYNTEKYTDDAWHLAAFVFDGTEGRLYVDGQLKASANDDVCNDIHDAETMVMGAYYADDQHSFIGSLDKVRIYNLALSQEEILQIYTNEQ